MNNSLGKLPKRDATLKEIGIPRDMSLDLRRGESDDVEEKKEQKACYSSGKHLKFEPYPTPNLKPEKVDSPMYFFKFANNSGVGLI